MKSKSESARWLWLGVAALAIAGIFAVVLVAARTPQLAAFTQLFSVALVVHVDLSVLLWFLCIGGMGWSALISKRGIVWPYWQTAAFILVAMATALMALSPMTKPWEVIKSNYIPVLNNGPFLTALALLAAGLCVMLVQLLVAYARASDRRKLSYVELGWLYAGFTTALALAAFYMSGDTLPEGLPLDAMFEQLFWAGGHLLQFSYCALMMAAWLLLTQKIIGRELKTFWIFIAYVSLAAGAIYGFAGFALYPQDILAINAHQSRVMIELLGVGPLLMAGIVAGPLVKQMRCRLPRLRGSGLSQAFRRSESRGGVVGVLWEVFFTSHHPHRRAPSGASTPPPQAGESGTEQARHRVYVAALLMSLILFGGGGVLGLMINGQNVTIPAHYHGSIVGVTLALMGAAYAMLPEFGYPSVARWRLAFWQPIIYGVGQLMHIGGLAYSGGYGVLRKTPDAAASLPMNLKISMGIMGLGGTLAIIGGLLFVIVMGKACLHQRRATGG